ncbi:glycosyltransferase family 1 protein [Pedobacter sp. SYSU D00535]|uniref:glycosyltransferase family 1 protein n=1 Tax=Pedobacter sp. SYSU D00535 TaxID=2810308 RepID=UPI001A961FDF|nr:glycosyltransferase family 1 protein [Pedobacter sp. SYSU D00535]
MKRVPENLLVFSHLRWDFVFQRPQHLLTRFAREFNVYFFEEPHFDVEAEGESYLSISKREDKLYVLVPHLPQGINKKDNIKIQKEILKGFLKDKSLSDFMFWYYTPMALEFSAEYIPDVIIYDCMDELSAFKNAPKELTYLEKELLTRADVVFTGGHCLYEAKKHQHQNIHPFPSSIDKEHFAQARQNNIQPADQEGVPGPKFGFYGVIDERFDHQLIGQVATLRPDWNFILIGPTVKINPEILPKNENIHYLGGKSYEELPLYLSGWDVAMIPFMLNESTRFISPTKTPEYLSGGVPVISTPIKDVVNPYGKHNLVSIVSTAEEFVAAAERELSKSKKEWLEKVDSFLADKSWDQTYSDMLDLIRKAIGRKVSVPLSA